MFKGIIFDLDGTTVQTIGDLTNAVNYIRNECGFSSISEDEVKAIVGHGLRNLVERTIPQEDKHDKAYQAFIDYYSKYYDIKSYAFDGMKEVLETLQEKGILIGINSNKRHELTESLIKKIYPTINFIKIVGQKDTAPIKPDPTGANEILDAMNLRKEEVCYIGDSPTDVKTGKNAGLYTVGVTWGFRSKEDVINACPDKIINTPKEILNLIK